MTTDMRNVSPCAVLLNGSLGSGVLIPGAAYRVTEVREHHEPSGIEGEPPVVTTVIRFDPVVWTDLDEHETMSVAGKRRTEYADDAPPRTLAGPGAALSLEGKLQ